MTLTGYSKLLLCHRHIIDLCRYEFMKFPPKADMQSEEAPWGSSSTHPGGPRGFHKNFIMYICTKSSSFVSSTQAGSTWELTGKHKFSLCCTTKLLAKDASVTVITEPDKEPGRSRKPWSGSITIQCCFPIWEINSKNPSMKKNGSNGARNDGEISKFKFIQSVRVSLK